jgi:hypothetical protein
MSCKDVMGLVIAALLASAPAKAEPITRKDLVTGLVVMIFDMRCHPLPEETKLAAKLMVGLAEEPEEKKQQMLLDLDMERERVGNAKWCKDIQDVLVKGLFK